MKSMLSSLLHRAADMYSYRLVELNAAKGLYTRDQEP
jgi:hypothetical protein